MGIDSGFFFLFHFLIIYIYIYSGPKFFFFNFYGLNPFFPFFPASYMLFFIEYIRSFKVDDEYLQAILNYINHSIDRIKFCIKLVRIDNANLRCYHGCYDIPALISNHHPHTCLAIGESTVNCNRVPTFFRQFLVLYLALV